MQTVGAQWFLVERKASPTVIAVVTLAALVAAAGLLAAASVGALPLLPDTDDERWGHRPT